MIPFDRAVTVVTRTPGAVDEHGNETTATTATHPGVVARRELLTATERVTLGFSSATYTYWFPPDAPVTAADRILDAGETLEVRGRPSLEATRRRPHHIEAVAEVVNP